MNTDTNFSAIVDTIFPYLKPIEPDSDTPRFENSPINLLGRFYLFSVKGIVISNEEEDIFKYITERYQSVLSAAYRANWAVLTVINGTRNHINLKFGFMVKDFSSSVQPEVFKGILKGLLPGLEISFDKTEVETLLKEKNYKGIVAGVPILRINEERQKVNLASVIRSLIGEEYTLLFISEPVSPNVISRQLKKIWEIRDECHKIAKQTYSESHGGEKSTQFGTNLSYTQSDSESTGASIIVLNANETFQESYNIGMSRSDSFGENWNENLSVEEQNSVAMELERLSNSISERLLKAMNIGEWSTTITFATNTDSGREVLTGSLLGELAKPSTDVFPPRVHFPKSNENSVPILIPAEDNISDIFNRSLATYLTSEELASISSPPIENLPGYNVKSIPNLSLSDTVAMPENKGNIIGAVCDHGNTQESIEIKFDNNDLAKHLFVCGLTGSGKTTTVKEIISKCEVPFLVIESAKREYRQLLGYEVHNETLKVFTIGDSNISPFQMNPFYIMEGVPPIVHIDYLKSIFNACFSLYGPMPHILEKCLYNVYSKRGWKLSKGIHPQLVDANENIDSSKYQSAEALHLFPTIQDLISEVQVYIKTELDYKGEISDNIRTAIVTRLESLCVGTKGLLFGTSKKPDIEAFLHQNTVLEMEDLSDDDDKAFFLGLILTFISEYRNLHDPAKTSVKSNDNEFQHLLIIEEAHRLLKNVSQEQNSELTGNPRGKAVEFFANVISEMRSKGQGVIVVEQIPTKILPDVIKNTNTKIVHRLVSSDDQALISSTLGLSVEESIYLTSLKRGHMLYLNDRMQRPVEVNVYFTGKSYAIEDNLIKTKMDADIALINDEYESFEIRKILSYTGEAHAIMTLCSIVAGGISNAENVIEIALLRIENELKRLNHTFSRHPIQFYLTNRIVANLMLGVFRIENDSFVGIVEIVKQIVSGEFENFDKFLQMLSTGWNSDDPVEELCTRIRDLVMSRTLGLRLDNEDRSKIDRITRSYFFIDIPNVHTKIVEQITQQLGE